MCVQHAYNRPSGTLKRSLAVGVVDIPRVDIAVGINPNLLSGVPSQPGDQVLELTREDFLNHGFITYNDTVYTVEHALKLAANSLGGTHWGDWNSSPQAQKLREHMDGSVWFGRPLPAAMMAAIAGCTLRACKPLADEFTRLGRYSPTSSEWIWSADGHCSVRATGPTSSSRD